MTEKSNTKKYSLKNAKYKIQKSSCDTENALGWTANKQSRPPGGLWRHWDNCCPVPVLPSNSTLLVFIYNAYSCKILQKDQLDIHVQ